MVLSIFEMYNSIRSRVFWHWENIMLCFKSLFFNTHLDQNYFSDILMEPIFSVVDNFTKFLGPFFVVCVILIMMTVIAIAYFIGLPYWWNKNPNVTIILVIVGNWLKWNTLFHYYKGVVTPPGYPPKGTVIQEAVSICKKCISPKPPRTHHCSVCNRCILKMDHHCPWLNNCVGHYNHRYFFMYMVFISLSTLFIMIFGYEIAYTEVWLKEIISEEVYGHPVRFDNSNIIPVPEWDNTTCTELPVEPPPAMLWRKRAIFFMAFICSGAFIALTWLSIWHAKQILRGETSIEAHINKAESKRLAALNQAYINPYNYGPHENFKIFFGIQEGSHRSWLHIIFPSSHRPYGNGLTWQNVNHIKKTVEEKKNP